MENKRSKAKARGSQNVSRGQTGRARELKTRYPKTDLWLVGQGSKRYSGGIPKNKEVLENTEMPNSDNQREPEKTEVEKTQNEAESYSNSGEEGISTKNGTYIIHEHQIETESQRLQRSARFTENQNVLQNEKEEMESANDVEGMSSIKKNSVRSKEDVAEHNTGRNAGVRNSANTSNAVSEIRLDGLEQELVRTSGALSLESVVQSHRGMLKDADIGSEKTIAGMYLKENLVSPASQSVMSNSRTGGTQVGVGSIKVRRIPQEVVQNANELYRIVEAESFKMIDARKPSSTAEVAGEESQGDQKVREVKFVLEGDVDKTFFLDSSLNVREAKGALSKKLKVISKNIILRANGRILTESKSLENVEDVTVELTVDESEESPCNVEGKAERPKVVQVKILQEDGTWKYSKVAVMNFGSRKQYMGGYRDKRTGQVYYHVICQTEPRKRTGKDRKLVTREVQTNLPTVDFGINTSQIGITQTSAKEAYSLNSSGKIIEARPYVPYNVVHKTMVPHRAAQIIQKAWRKYIFRQFLLKHFEKLAASLQERVEEESSALKTVQKRRVQNMTGAIFPSFRSHFSDALTFVDSWARIEAGRLAGRKMGFARKAAMIELLRFEQKMLYVAETHRLRAVEENLRRQDIMFLEGAARSRARMYKKGNVTLVDDLNIQRAGVFKEMFASYSRTDTTPTERLEILNCVHGTLLEEFGLNHPTVNDLLEILDREIDLITIGFPNAKMLFLRKRFETKFLHLARDPKVNPQAKYFRKTHVTKKKFAIRRCKLCNRNLPSSMMFRHVRMKQFRTCMSCAQLEQNVAADQMNLAPYKRILHAMRASELEKCCRSAIPFLVQPLGTYFLVSVIWNGKSILSGNGDLTQLRMTRWLPDQDWSVWNMVLLTEKEVVEHDRIPDPMTHYPEEFILQVRTRNILGRMNFMYLVDVDNDFKFDRGVSVGTLPRDHLLYTNKLHGRYIPDNKVPGFLKPAMR